MFKKILIIGYGRSGQWFCNFLSSKKIDFVVYDDNGYVNPNLDNVDAAYISPGILRGPLNRHAIFQTLGDLCIPIISDYDIFHYYQPNAKIIGITGSAGKTTTTMLISHLLKSADIEHHMCGNLGIDIFNMNHNLYVMELGAAQLEFIKYFSVDYGIITNIIPDHLDFFECKERYVAAKLNIMNKSNIKKQKFILGEGCPIITSQYNNIPIIDIQYDDIPNRQLLLEHNFKNLTMAFSVLNDLGISKEVLASLKDFQFARFRQEFCYEDQYNLVINDSKCTNEISIKAAVENFQNIVLFCGGRLKNTDVSFLDNIKLANINTVVCFGEHREVLAQFFKKHHIKAIMIDKLSNSAEILETFILNKEKKCLLLSPIGQSYDEFTNYIERGEMFAQLIKTIIQKHKLNIKTYLE